jgi:hypothetical protein
MGRGYDGSARLTNQPVQKRKTRRFPQASAPRDAENARSKRPKYNIYVVFSYHFSQKPQHKCIKKPFSCGKRQKEAPPAPDALVLGEPLHKQSAKAFLFSRGGV